MSGRAQVVQHAILARREALAPTLTEDKIRAVWLPNEVRVREAVRRDEEQRLLLASERRAEFEVARLIVGVVGAVKLRLCALPLVSSSDFCQVPCLSCLLLFGLAVGLVVPACLQCPACSPQARGGGWRPVLLVMVTAKTHAGCDASVGADSQGD